MRAGSAREPAGCASSRSSASTAVSAASRRAAARRGSRSPCTLTVAGPLRPVAGIHAEAVLASSARRQKVRWASASRRTASLTSGSAVHAIASQQLGQVALGVHARLPVQVPPLGEVLQGGHHGRGDDRDHGAGGQQGPHPAQRDGASADDDHAAARPGAGPAAAAARRGPRRSPGVHEPEVGAGEGVDDQVDPAVVDVPGVARDALADEAGLLGHPLRGQVAGRRAQLDPLETLLPQRPAR